MWLEQDGCYYLKHPLLLGADHEHGDVAARITDLRDMLVRDLEGHVLEHEGERAAARGGLRRRWCRGMTRVMMRPMTDLERHVLEHEVSSGGLRR